MIVAMSRRLVFSTALCVVTLACFVCDDERAAVGVPKSEPATGFNDPGLETMMYVRYVRLILLTIRTSPPVLSSHRQGYYVSSTSDVRH